MDVSYIQLCDGLLLLYDISDPASTQGMDRPYNIYTRVRKDEMKIIQVATKLDLDHRVTEEDLRLPLQEYPHVRTSANTGQGMRTLSLELIFYFKVGIALDSILAEYRAKGNLNKFMPSKKKQTCNIN
jgi:50S ribosomal subunit-associated GTPase HflX